MAKASSSIDLKAAKDAHDDAAKTATSYITDIDSQTGITIKAVLGENEEGDDDTKKNYIKLNANDGMEVFKGGVSVSKYSDTMRVGKAESYHTEVDDDGFRLIDNEQTAVMDVAYSGEERQDAKPRGRIVGANTGNSSSLTIDNHMVMAVSPNMVLTITIKETSLDDDTINKATDTYTVPYQSGTSTKTLLNRYALTYTLTTVSQSMAALRISLHGNIPIRTHMECVATEQTTYYVPSLVFSGVTSFADDVSVQGKKLTYDAGDAITNTIWYGSGFLTSSSTEIYFTLPLSRVITASTVTVTSLALITRQNNKYTHGSASSTRVTWTPISATITPSGVRIGASCSTTTNAINNDVIGINAQIALEFS